ncbi:MAG: F0F1 ATP synthase subunit B [Acidimicrobiia bacterium]|nr:F0F1 ATP synthase subunit B [Acidimicrobiia bacterium]MDH3462142.1 F0F1 ATP synthase subunit B [Acidimicrobiia bacterium]
METLAQILVFAADEGEDSGGGLDLLLPPLNELIAGIIAFAIVFFFIWKWAVPAINKMLEQRQAAIGGQLAEAEKAKADAESLLADYRAQLAEAKAEGNRIIEEARGTAEQMKSEVVAKAEADAGQILDKARQEAEAERDRALAEARKEVGSISVDLAGRIVGESLDANAHKALVDRYLADLEKM